MESSEKSTTHDEFGVPAPKSFEINEELNAPKTYKDCLPVLKRESELRQSDHYINQAKAYIEKHSVPPVELDQWAQNSALKEKGYDVSKEAIRQYQKLVMRASEQDRKDIFFLKANDLLFHPHKNPVDKDLTTELYDRNKQPAKFTDVDLEDKKAYFIIAAPST